jgi:hypothetical protein
MDMREAFRQAPLVINDYQAGALALLMADGKLAGTTYDDVEPPTSVAIFAVGARESLGQPVPMRHPITREDVMDPADPRLIALREDPSAHTIAVVAEDGRCWQIVRAGICWPVDR